MSRCTHQNRNANHFIFNFFVCKNNHLRSALKKGILYLLWVLFVQLPAFAQDNSNAGKIDPVFRYIIAAKNTANHTAVNLPESAKKILPTKGFASTGAAEEEKYECIVYTKNAKALRDSGYFVSSILPAFATAWVSLEDIDKLAAMPEVRYVEAPQVLHKLNDIAVGSSGASLLHHGRLNNTVYKGKNVLVAIFDSGIDWKHLDFRNPGDTTKSRILRIWDQTLIAGFGEAPPTGFSYGVEYTQNQINNEIDGSPAHFVREKDIEGHGTHVAGTAAGNGQSSLSGKYTGMAPESDIIVIKGGDGTFTDTRIIDALTYLKNLSTTLAKPVVVNLSLGNLFGPHDGTRPMEIAIDNFSASAAGRVVAVAAGNDGGSNKHNRVNLTGNGAGTVSFTVPDGTLGTDVFSYRIYSNTSGSITATVNNPLGTNPVTANAGQSVNGNVLGSDFTVFLTNSIDINDNNRYVDVSLQRNGSNMTSPAGTWTLTLTNNTSTALTLDGWLYNVSTDFQNTALVNGDNNYLVSSPGNAASAITVGSYVGRNSWYTAFGQGYSYTNARQDSISDFSARGPRRDNIIKPDISAVGQAAISCLSSDEVNPDSAYVIEKGLYFLEQGTSMATPGVTGATALLLQANASATASQLKSLLTANASKDVMTELNGPTPNTTWGHGKLDVFKAASALFNCGPSDRKTYKYDSSTRSGLEIGFSVTTQRIGVRFTPDITGKLGGVYYQTSGLATDLVFEIRANNAGVPGTLLGTLNVKDSLLQKFSWNYIDISSLNVSVTSGTDYFVVIYRNPASLASWSIRAENIFLYNRSVLSANNGAVWSGSSNNFKIRSVVYTNGQLPGNIATVNSTDIRNINSTNQFINSNCQLIAQLVPNGLNPVTGSVTGKVWIEGSVPHVGGSPFVQRHYEITPATGTNTTARVTLYCKQAEFTAFNSDPGSILDLPTGPADVAGKSNLRVAKYPGTSNNNSGLPGTYSGTPSIIDPADADIVWNAEASRWEISFNVTGFSGFIIQTNATILPISVEYFRGNTEGTVNILNWKVNCTNNSATFAVERSNDGTNFNSIGTLSTIAQNGCLLPFTFKDAAPFPGKNYYRIKITENTGDIVYTNIIVLQNDNQLITRVYPTVINKGSGVWVSFSGIKGTLSITDALGRKIVNRKVANGVQSINPGLDNAGVYFYTIKDDKAVLSTGKIIVE
ncbi:MAG: S8 family peptidase [Ginsengibacter sp.]